MGGYNILIYGSGNCELGGRLGEIFEELEHIENNKHVKVFGRAHIFSQSCLNMYGRFEQIKECIDLSRHSGQGGIYEYFYDGSQIIKTCEMKIQPVTKDSFEQFLSVGKERLATDEVILLLMGQGNMQGMFMDFALDEPRVLGYEDIFKCIGETLYPKVSRVHLIMDMANWNYIKLPLLLSKNAFFKSAFIYKRPRVSELFPLGKFIQNIDQVDVYNALRQEEIGGYSVNLGSMWTFEKLDRLWRAYQNNGITGEMLAEYYRQLVKGIHVASIDAKDFEKLAVLEDSKPIEEIKDYFKRQYGIIVDEQNLNEWLESLKICTDYHML